MALSRFVLTSDVTVNWPGSTIAAPAVPASTVAVQNTNVVPVTVVITGGTMTAVVVNGVTVGTGAGTYVVPVAGTISMTYLVAPTWAWAPHGAMPAGYQTKFIKGTAIYADSAAGSSGPQLLYQAIGAGNLRAYVQGKMIAAGPRWRTRRHRCPG
jgi:hypothetical protein